MSSRAQIEDIGILGGVIERLGNEVAFHLLENKRLRHMIDEANTKISELETLKNTKGD